MLKAAVRISASSLLEYEPNVQRDKKSPLVVAENQGPVVVAEKHNPETAQLVDSLQSKHTLDNDVDSHRLRVVIAALE